MDGGRLGTGIVAAALLAGAALPAAANDWIYLHRDNGVPTYSDKRPVRTSYARLPRTGRVTAAASCRGLTERDLQARARHFAPLIEQHAKRNGLDPELVSAVMRVESCYDVRAVSKSGARGLMQLMPATALELGVSNSFSPEQNIEGGTRYLGQMLRRFGNDIPLALAAYNAGPGTVERHGNRIPDFPVTQSYVKRILKLYGRGS